MCADDELGSVICSLWTDSFRQEITAICVAVAESEGSYSPPSPPARRAGAHTGERLHSHQRD